MAITEQDLRQLRDQLERSRSALERQQQEDAAQMKRYEEQYRQLREDLLQSTQLMQQDMAERLQLLEADMRQKYVMHVTEMREQYQARIDEIHALEDQYNQRLADLDAQQKQVLAEIDRTRYAAREIARQQEENYNDLKCEALLHPTDVFFPHRLEQYLQAGERARHLMEEGLYTLSANDYSNISLGIRGLIADTEYKVHELDNMFVLYNTMVENASLFLTSPWELKDENGDTVWALDDVRDVDYWSDGQFSRLSDVLEYHRKVAEDGAQAWIDTHVHSAEPMALLLDREMQALEKIPRQLQFCISYALSACDCYNHLFDLRDQTIVILQGQNYVFQGLYYGKKNPISGDTPGYLYYQQWLKGEQCLVLGGDPDYREERCLRFVNPGGNVCHIYMVPVRTGAVVGYTLRLESIAEHAPHMVLEALRRVLSQNLGRPLEDADRYDAYQAAADRVFTADALREVALVSEYQGLSPKYCSGL